MADDKKTSENIFSDMKKHYQNLVNMLEGKISEGWILILAVLATAFAVINPTLSLVIFNNLLNQFRGAFSYIKEKGPETFSKFESELTMLRDEFTNYVNYNKSKWKITIVLYGIVMVMLISFGIIYENSWVFVPGSLMLIIPIYLLGMTLNGLGKTFKSNKDKDGKIIVNNVLRTNGSTIKLIAALLLIFMLQFVLFKLFWTGIIIFLIIAIGFITFAFIYKETSSGLIPLMRLTTLVTGIFMLMLLVVIADNNSEPFHKRIHSWTNMGDAKNNLATVENNNKAASINDVAKEREKVYYSITMVETPVYIGITNTKKVSGDENANRLVNIVLLNSIPKNTVINVLKEDYLYDVDCIRYIRVKYEKFEGYVRASNLETMDETEAVTQLAQLNK